MIENDPPPPPHRKEGQYSTLYVTVLIALSQAHNWCLVAALGLLGPPKWFAFNHCYQGARFTPNSYYIPGGPIKTEQSIQSIFQDFALINSYFSSPYWIEHLLLIIITPRSSNLVENFLFYE